MFEITPDDIAAIEEEDLRTLIGLLCEAELQKRGLPTVHVTYGGNQNAADGGIDVRVSLPAGHIEGYIPRLLTGFQVKKHDMPRGDITTEMRPSGTIRPAIAELANQAGAYIIVSANGSTADTALTDRRNAMTDAMNGVDNADGLAMEFYDRTRIASWVRSHPGLIPWVRQKIGRAIPGWQSYGAWAYNPEGTKAEYLIDDKLRIHKGKVESEKGISPLQAIQEIRDTLRMPGNVIRLVGLSGVGKTRLVQALFDSRVGESPLDSSLAFYTDISHSPNPQPVGLASDLIAAQTAAILVIDNCSPALHRNLVDVCRSANSTISVITIEYDIRENETEGTDVFKLEPSSNELIEKLIKYRYPHVSAVDRQKVSEVSGGNARIALALANTIGKNETVARLTDDELFIRLFHQTHVHDESLLLVAQACSLVYSFQGEDVSDGQDAELVKLGAMVGKNANEVYRNVAELYRRNLVQQRSVWRAVLPHAIANRLAARALENIPPTVIDAQLVVGASERLLKSFSRRLSFLHDSPKAVTIVNQWLAEGGLLADVANLNATGKEMFSNIAPVSPEAVLSLLERTLLTKDGDQAIPNCTQYLSIIRSLAYDAALFDRCIALLLKFIDANNDDSREASEIFASLFFIYLSGTHAPIEQRLSVIEKLLLSDNSSHRNLGIRALSAALEAWHFSSGYGFEFGARSRNYGFFPGNDEELKHWFNSVLGLSQAIACSDAPVAPLVGSIIAGKFRGLWTMAAMYDEMEEVCRTIAKNQFWREGWIAVRQIQQYDAAGFLPDIQERLAGLEELLRPVDTVQKVRTIVLSKRLGNIDLGGFEEYYEEDDSKEERINAIATGLGKEVGADSKLFEELLPELHTGSGLYGWPFGEGLAQGTNNPQAVWNALINQYAKAERPKNFSILRGFLRGTGQINSNLVDTFLDEAYQHDGIADIFPVLQTSITIDQQGVRRIKAALALDKCPIGMYANLAIGRATDSISGVDLRDLLFEIASKPEGFNVAIEILHMRLHSDGSQKKVFPPEVLDAGRTLLRDITFTRDMQEDDYRLGVIVRPCLEGEGGIEITRQICQKLEEAIRRRGTHPSGYDDLLQGLFKVQPSICLDEFFSGDADKVKQGIRMIQNIRQNHKNPLEQITDEQLFAWCDQEPDARYPVMAALITPFAGADEEGEVSWSQTALHLLDKAPDKVAVMRKFISRFLPMSWSGSRSSIVERNAKLLDRLPQYADPDLVAFLAEEKAKLIASVERDRRLETERHKDRDERFE